MSTRTEQRNRRSAAAAIGASLATLAALAVLSSAGGHPGPGAPAPAAAPAAPVPAGMVWVIPAARRMVVGSDQEVTATVPDHPYSERKSALAWSIDDQEVATLTVLPGDVARITARAPGWLTITATSGEASGSALVQVLAR